MTLQLPRVQGSDWMGWVWPVPIWQGRVPRVSQEWKPGHDPGVGNNSGATSNHLGVDIMFPKRPGDPAGAVKHDASRGFIAPPGTPIIAAGPGKIWGTYNTPYGLSILIDHGTVSANTGGVTTFYQHMESFAREWQKGDSVAAGELLGTMGYSHASADGEGLRHLHFELRFPRAGVPSDDTRINPEPYMALWQKIDMDSNPPETPSEPFVPPSDDGGVVGGDDGSQARRFGGAFMTIMFLLGALLLVKATGGKVELPAGGGTV